MFCFCQKQNICLLTYLILRPRWNKIEIMLYQRENNVVQHRKTAVSKLCNIEKATSKFVLFSISDQHYFNVEQRWSAVEMSTGWLICKINDFYYQRAFFVKQIWLVKYVELWQQQQTPKFYDDIKAGFFTNLVY